MAYAVIISRGIKSLPMLKCSSERWVCAPQSLSAGTSTTPRLSVSFLMLAMCELSYVRSCRAGALQRQVPLQADRPPERHPERFSREIALRLFAPARHSVSPRDLRRELSSMAVRLTARCFRPSGLPPFRLEYAARNRHRLSTISHRKG